MDGYLSTKAKIIENWPWLTNANVLDRVDRVTLLFGTIAIVTGEYRVKDVGTVAFMRVWQKRNDQWLAIASQHSSDLLSMPVAPAVVTDDIRKPSTVRQVAKPLTLVAQSVFDTYRSAQESFYRGAGAAKLM
jgi:hypothetical protein